MMNAVDKCTAIGLKTVLIMWLGLFHLQAWAGDVKVTEPLGVITVSKMTQGQLLWLKGRVGEGIYRFTRNHQQCELLIPVAVGSRDGNSIGISDTEGLSIAVTSDKLNQALQSGERVLSSNWQFAYGAQSHQVDGVVLNGVNKSETFVLNSRQRWVSWLLDGRAQVRCLNK